MRAAPTHWLRFVVGLGVTALCLWLAFRHMRFDEIAGAARSLEWLQLTFALLALTAGYAARIYRWWWMLRLCSPSVRWRSCAWPLLAGFAVNNVVPFRGGDALRVIGFREELNTPAMGVLGSLVVERLLDVTILLALFLAGMLDLRTMGFPVIYVRMAIVVASVGALAWVALLWMGDELESLLIRICRARVLSKWNWSASAEHSIRQLFKNLSIVRLPGATAGLLSITAIVWLCEGGVFAAVAAGFHYSGGVFGPWFALASGSLATILPSSPGYVGTFDYFTTSAFITYGVDRAVAIAMAVIVHLVLWVPITGAGLAYLLAISWRGRRRPLPARPVQEEERL